jgi:hypothetical protein
MSESIPHRQFRASSRPKKRGPIPCSYPECGASFKDEGAAFQHRRDVHNEGTPQAAPSAREGEK